MLFRWQAVTPSKAPGVPSWVRDLRRISRAGAGGGEHLPQLPAGEGHGQEIPELLPPSPPGRLGSSHPAAVCPLEGSAAWRLAEARVAGVGRRGQVRREPGGGHRAFGSRLGKGSPDATQDARLDLTFR